MTEDEASARRLRELIEQGAEPPANEQRGALRRGLRRMSLRVGRPNARHQQLINRAMQAELERCTGLGRGLDELREWLSNVQREHEELRQQLTGLSVRLPADLPLYGDETIPLETFDSGLVGMVVGFRQSTRDDVLNRAYVGFEEYFRGTEQRIKQRQVAYMPLLKGCGPILDVGCGRGELLELMAEAAIEARGVDLDAAMVDRCRDKGLDAEIGDAVGALEALTDETLGAIVALQVIEHLPYAALLTLLRAAHSKLRQGGRMILETVNPHSPQAMKHFWIDPTHHHPLFPEVVVALCSLTGFRSAYIWYPQGRGAPDRDRTQQPDYAIVAER